MKMTLRRIRDARHLKRKTAAALFNMSIDRLTAIEEYRELPTFLELNRMLRVMNDNFDEVPFIIWNDINLHFKPKVKSEYEKLNCMLELETHSAALLETLKTCGDLISYEDKLTFINRILYGISELFLEDEQFYEPLCTIFKNISNHLANRTLDEFTCAILDNTNKHYISKEDYYENK